MSEITDERGIRIDYVVAGEGPPALVLHGAYSTRDETMPVLQPLLTRRGMRGIHPDLPGWGLRPDVGHERRRRPRMRSTPSWRRRSPMSRSSWSATRSGLIWLAASPPVIRVASRGSPSSRPTCATSSRHPSASSRTTGPGDDLGDSERDEYFGYFQVRTAATRERFERFVRPALGRYDAVAVERIMTDDAMDPDPDAAPFAGPAAILVGRDDALVGWRAQRSLIDQHPRGTFAIVADAGHALLHERPELVMAVLDDWLDRVAIGSL